MISYIPFLTVLATFPTAVITASRTNWNNVTGTSNITFPTDVGNLNDIVYGGLPFNAQEDKLNSTEFQKYYAPEMRWLPKNADKDNATSDDIFKNFGPYTPWRPAEGLFPETEAFRTLPKQCNLKQVHLLYRHGSRYPTDGLDSGPGAFFALVQNATRNGTFKATGELDFLHSWNYSLGKNILNPQGTQELFDHGVRAYYEYAKLLANETDKPVIRTTSSSRVLDSARYWTLGFFGWDAEDKMNLEVLTEAPDQNNTLEPKYSCPNGKKFSFGDDMRKEWQKLYLQEPMKRIQKDIHGLNLTIEDMANMISLCAYETPGIGYSSFCNLFSRKEYEGFEYDADLKFQGNSGFMNPMGKAMGIGYVTEFINRATNSNYSGPQAEQNNTLDKNTTYFPLKKPLYADFSHDSSIVNILTAFNFTQIGDYMNATNPDPHRRFRASQIVPFAAKIAFEIMDCDENNESNEFIRVKINDALLPLDQGQGCEKRKDAICKLDNFIQHLKDNAYRAAKFNLSCYGKNGSDFTITKPVKSGALTDEMILKN